MKMYDTFSGLILQIQIFNMPFITAAQGQRHCLICSGPGFDSLQGRIFLLLLGTDIRRDVGTDFNL